MNLLRVRDFVILWRHQITENTMYYYGCMILKPLYIFFLDFFLFLGFFLGKGVVEGDGTSF